MDNPDLKSTTVPGVPDADNKRNEAQAALAGAKWTEKHERETRAKTLQSELDSFGARVAEIAKEKEKLELAWIELDNQRRSIRTILNPILNEEKKVETEEIALEIEEGKTGLAADKQIVEKKRWLVQDKRKAIEQKKWEEEDKLAKIEQTIQEDTNRYRVLLDEEEKASKEIEQRKLELASLNTSANEQPDAGE